jgi:glycosyltransferase involved in cell wall biosynthesis
LKISHFGNTANNAYHNVKILQAEENVVSHLPVRMFGLSHPISAPAWDEIDFEIPDFEWVSEPDWSRFPDAANVNSRFTDLLEKSSGGPQIVRRRHIRDRVVRVLKALRLLKAATLLFQEIAYLKRSQVPKTENGITILYGLDSLNTFALSRHSKQTVALEHGQLRWALNGPKGDSRIRSLYKRQLANVSHVWVTNLDPATIDAAKILAPGKWSALPHPFAFDQRVPYASDLQERMELLNQTRSSALVLLASSQNWSPYHDKGSRIAAEAFVELRKTGVDVGLVAVSWGLDLEKTMKYFRDNNVSDYVKWINLMPRHRLQRLMANVDLVWDQFGLEAFGALALRTLEQGAPLVSRGLSDEGNSLLGVPVPWEKAANTQEVVSKTTGILSEIKEKGLETVHNNYRKIYRDWLDKYHSPRITASLQLNRYSELLDPNPKWADAEPDAWRKIVANNALGL